MGGSGTPHLPNIQVLYTTFLPKDGKGTYPQKISPFFPSTSLSSLPRYHSRAQSRGFRAGFLHHLLCLPAAQRDAAVHRVRGPPLPGAVLAPRGRRRHHGRRGHRRRAVVLVHFNLHGACGASGSRHAVIFH